MRVNEIMSTPAWTIEPGESVAVGLRMMRENRIHHLIVTKGKNAVGLVSVFELDHAEDKAAPISEYMTSHVATCDPHTKVKEVANLLRGRSIGCLAVIEDGKPIGIVTISDLLESVGKGIEKAVPRGRRRTMFRRGSRVKPMAPQKPVH